MGWGLKNPLSFIKMRVNILGLGSGWHRAPEDGEVWSVPGIVLKRTVSLIFSLHPLDLWLETTSYGEEVIKKINELKIPIISVELDDRLPNSELFPIDDMPRKYFTSSLAYMIAYAIYKGATDIRLYGVPLVLKEEYLEQKSCVEFWLGVATGKGIEVVVHGRTSLFSTGTHAGRYGYEWNQLYQKIP